MLNKLIKKNKNLNKYLICPKCKKQSLDTINNKTHFCLDQECGFVGRKLSYCEQDFNTRS